MVRGVRYYLVGSVVLGVLGVLAGCSGGNYFAEREPWRLEAEAQCINSGAIREGAGVVRVKAISGPGMCGADFPLRVSTLGEGTALSYGDELRPPGAIPNASGQPRWPIAEPRPSPPAPTYEAPYDPRYVSPSQVQPPPYDPRVVRPPQRAVPGPRVDPGGRYDQPVSLDPPPPVGAPAAEPFDFRRPYGAPKPPPERAPVLTAPLDAASPAYDLSPEPYERRRAIGEPRAPARIEVDPREPVRMPAPQTVPLGPARGAPVTGALASVSVSPAATLACPLVSALDQWIASAVQPSALRWFSQPVVEIRQISAYSCRGLNGNSNARISEHAFGNALDIASFTLADGRKIVVKSGWHGSPEEQGFLRDVQGAACEQFTTVLAPGSNVYHYDHIHVDLMRRRDGRHACNPHAVAGEEVAARARATYASKRVGDASITGSIAPRRLASPPGRLRTNAYSNDRSDRDLPNAEPGNDGEF
jgi:hypothetical protein